MKTNRLFSIAFLVIISFFCIVPLQGNAQFIAIARKIRNLNSGNNDVATVIMDAGAAKVFKAAVDTVTAHKKYLITKRENVSHHLEFSNEETTLTLQVDSLQANLCQITVVLAEQYGSPSKSATESATNMILAICRKLNLHCTTKD